MEFTGFTEEDFAVFTIDGLEARMEKLIEQVRPKLQLLGEYFAPELSGLTGEEMFYHVAKHARRTVNPPKDTWVAIASSNRGYKKLPHFQIGLFETHLFVWFAIIYESLVKVDYSKALGHQLQTLTKHIPDSFVWSVDHMKPDAVSHASVKGEQLEQMVKRLGEVKKAELLCGIHVSKEEAVKMDGASFIAKVEETFKTLLPLYDLKKQVYSA
ncbi:hypothetical protein A374_12885 [Fictibacillus macauensis ZFHKF-1]|uniref:UPF0637 protein A374_12885 n=1 Tax=Fictibacillus macauensis ZFHKF-1 TaxID=1196324 RepID=I8AGX1_9BACL|nr:DUF1054 domain-containing protein [Fictibacillus macauensis]EIT84942.1 hypothetical protein A374_12885 [Fictibacillus macauensis ZFHKF-1]